MPAQFPIENKLPLTLLTARNAYLVDSSKPLGRQSAGASFLEAYFRYSGNQLHSIVVPDNDEAEWFHQQAQTFNPKTQTRAYALAEWGDAAKVSGAIHIPDPGINHWAWKRMFWGDGGFSMLGIVHTLCSFNVQNALGQYATAPIRHWDALICTSEAARNAVEGFLDRQEYWIRKRNEACRFERPQLPVIPLGIHPEEWAPPTNKLSASLEARAQLNLPINAKIVLLVGRLDLLTKIQPAPMLKAFAELQENSFSDLELLIYGEAPNDHMKQIWHQGARAIAPKLKIHWIPGRQRELAAAVRWASDIFVSLSDNPQETFGITPLEAMAAELPCVVSDWNGYRESVLQPGETSEPTGLRVTTRMVEGLGEPEAKYLLHETMAYPDAVGRISQGISVDLEEFKRHLSTLLQSAEMRRTMGQAGRKRIERHYDWLVVMNRWRDLLAELNERRQNALGNGSCIPPQLPPWMPSTSEAFGCFATEVLPRNWAPAPPTPADEAEHLNNPFQSWDQELLHHTDARRLGWWLKQGLIKP